MIWFTLSTLVSIFIFGCICYIFKFNYNFNNFFALIIFFILP